MMRRNPLLLLFFIIGTCTFASFFGGRISYTLFYFSLAIPAVAVIYSIYVYFSIRFIQEVKNKMVIKEEPTDFEFCLCNENIVTFTGVKVRFFQDKSYLMNIDENKEYCLLPGQRESVQTKICCKYRGEYSVGIQSVAITDFLDLFTIHFPITSNLQVSVLPRVVNWTKLDFIYENEDEKRVYQSMNKEEEPDAEVRNYVQGDSLKKIHWKASAKSNQLLARNYRAINKQQITIFIDLSVLRQDEMERVNIEDSMIEQTLSLVNYCMHEKLPCTVIYEQSGAKGTIIKNHDDLDAFFKWCSKVPFISSVAIEELFVLSGSIQDQVAHHIFITHKLTKDFYGKMLAIASTNKKVSIILVASHLTNMQNEMKKNLENSGVRILFVSYLEKGGSHGRQE